VAEGHLNGKISCGDGFQLLAAAMVNSGKAVCTASHTTVDVAGRSVLIGS
jgi:hypothetical protein